MWVFLIRYVVIGLLGLMHRCVRSTSPLWRLEVELVLITSETAGSLVRWFPTWGVGPPVKGHLINLGQGFKNLFWAHLYTMAEEEPRFFA